MLIPRVFAISVLIAGVCAACGSKDPAPGAAAVNTVSGMRPKAWGDHYELRLDRAQFTGTWPLVPSVVTLICKPYGPDAEIAVVRYNGVDYALNGTARAQWPGVRDIEPIWLDNEEIPGTKVPISDLIDAGRAVCLRR